MRLPARSREAMFWLRVWPKRKRAFGGTVSMSGDADDGGRVGPRAGGVTVWYNDTDPFVAQWLRNLIGAGHLPAGDVDERPIQEIQADDLKGYTQCHFFAGIGGWPLALELAGWGTRSVWTGSCPCQPFSVAGKRGGHADERHLWPAWFRLIRECRPATVFGEQVSSSVGRSWFAAVRADLETLGYAVGGADLCAAGVGAPHIRQRLWFVGESDSEGYAVRTRQRRNDGATTEPPPGQTAIQAGATRGVDNPASARRDGPRQGTEGETRDEARLRGPERGCPWDNLVWLPCRDGKARPTQPGLFPLADGVPGRVGRLRAYGNAIVPQVAAAFVKAYLDGPP